MLKKSILVNMSGYLKIKIISGKGFKLPQTKEKKTGLLKIDKKK